MCIRDRDRQGVTFRIPEPIGWDKAIVRGGNAIVDLKPSVEAVSYTHLWWDLVRFDKAFDLVPSLREHKGEDYMMLFPIPLSTISVEPDVYKRQM